MLKYKLIQLLRIRTGAQQVALGFVTGFFPCWFPTFGAGAALSIGITKLIKGNIVASIISAALGSILWPVLFLMNFKVGKIWRAWADTQTIVADSNIDIVEVEYIETIDSINEWSTMGIDFLVGSIINSLLFTILGYFIIRFILDHYRHSLLRLIRNKGKSF